MQKRNIMYALLVANVFILIAIIKLWYQDIPLYMKSIFTFTSAPVILFLTLVVYNNINKYFLYGISFLTLLVITYIQLETPIIKIDAQIFVALVLFFLLISLQWLLYIINHIDEENITHKQAFWVSVALIIWSVFALFRLFLNQWLYDYDRDVFSIIAYLFNIANITMYLFFLQGLRVINKKDNTIHKIVRFD